MEFRSTAILIHITDAYWPMTKWKPAFLPVLLPSIVCWNVFFLVIDCVQWCVGHLLGGGLGIENKSLNTVISLKTYLLVKGHLLSSLAVSESLPQFWNRHSPTCWRAIFFGKQFHKYNFSTCTYNISLDKHYCQVTLYVATRWCSSALIKRRKNILYRWALWSTSTLLKDIMTSNASCNESNSKHCLVFWLHTKFYLCSQCVSI